MPIIFVEKFDTEPTSTELSQENIKKADYGKYNQINLFHHQTSDIELIDFDTYLYGVVSAEMPADYEFEALKAQAVVARTYTIYQITQSKKHENADICDNAACCQAWISKENRFSRWDENLREFNWNKITNAVNTTSGEIIYYNNQPINAFFHSNSGGQTEIPINVWGGSYPYLQIVSTSGEDSYSSYLSEVFLTKDELIQKMFEKYPNFKIDFNEINCIQILDLTDSQRVKTIKIGNINLNGIEARKIFNLKSSNFTFEIINDTIKFKVIGYGHGVGLSQSGSDSLAKQGYSYNDIINHYYKNVEIKNTFPII